VIVADFQLAAIGIPEEAAAVITAVIAGEVNPELGATRLAGIWVPAEELGSGPGSPSTPPRGSVASLNHLANELVTAQRTAEARRLAELNWLLARRAADETTAVRCAATLAQLIGSDPAAVRHRLDLLEYAVPAVLASDEPEVVKAVLLANLTQARYNAAGGDPDTLTAAVEASRQALAIDADIGEVWLADLHFMAGTALQTLGDLAGDEDRYRESIASLNEVLNYYGPRHHPGAYASALNNLGVSCRKLGARTGDAALVQTAIECFDLALPYRPDAVLTRTTQANRAEAVRLLEAMPATTPSPGAGADATATAKALAFLEAGDAALTKMRSGGDGDGEAEPFMRRATGQFLAAAKLTGRDSPPDLRAKVYHRLATGFATAEEDDALWTGVCFAAAARRLGGEALAAVQRGRLAFHLGFMLAKIGFPDQLTYLRQAEALLKEALPPLAAGGNSGELDYAARLHDQCLTALAAFGDQDARDQSLRKHAERELARIDRQLSESPADEVRGAYRDYLTLVRESAGPELASFLAAGHLTRVRTAIARGGEYPAMVLARTAAGYRNVGDLAGALEVAADAESRAGDVSYFAPAAWCELASFYTTVPARDDAERCLRHARETAEQAGSAAEPDQVEAVAAAVAATGGLPGFDPAVTAAALASAGDTDRLRRVLEQGLQSIGKAES
jgi:tetratricopeptide (TPR) repeat protein